MHGASRALLGAVSLTLLLTGLGMPVEGAARGDLAIVNGIPGVKADVCLDGKEVRSALPYGKVVLKKTTKGKKVLKVFRRDPRRCRGKLLAKRTFWLRAGADKTMVVTRKKPLRVVMFDNPGLDGHPCPDTSLAWRHAADVGTVTFNRGSVRYRVEPFGPASSAASSDLEWVKGDEQTSLTCMVPKDVAYITSVTRPGSSSALVGPIFTRYYGHDHFEWILVGTWPRNARLVVIQRPIGSD
jgi:hypothetical protein